jgi:hypothetical protein
LFVTSSDTRCLEIFFETKMIPPNQTHLFSFCFEPNRPERTPGYAGSHGIVIPPLICIFLEILKNFYLHK